MRHLISNLSYRTSPTNKFNINVYIGSCLFLKILDDQIMLKRNLPANTWGKLNWYPNTMLRKLIYEKYIYQSKWLLLRVVCCFQSRNEKDVFANKSWVPVFSPMASSMFTVSLVFRAQISQPFLNICITLYEVVTCPCVEGCENYFSAWVFRYGNRMLWLCFWEIIIQINRA